MFISRYIIWIEDFYSYFACFQQKSCQRYVSSLFRYLKKIKMQHVVENFFLKNAKYKKYFFHDIHIIQYIMKLKKSPALAIGMLFCYLIWFFPRFDIRYRKQMEKKKLRLSQLSKSSVSTKESKRHSVETQYHNRLSQTSPIPVPDTDKKITSV